MAKKQLNVTDITIEKIDIESSFGKYDLVPHLEELNIYEDIFSNHMTGHTSFLFLVKKQLIVQYVWKVMMVSIS